MSWFTNGTLNGTQPYSTAIGSDTVNLQIGATNGTTDVVNGYVSNLRVVKGRAVYTSSFTPSTVPLGATSGGQSPPTGTQTSLLTCQSNRIVDNSSNAFAITRSGDVSVQAFSPFAPTAAYDAAVVGGSAYFDGTLDYLKTPSSASFTFGTGDFTAEAWVYPTALSSNRVIFDFRASNDTSGYQLGLNSTTTPYVANSGGGILNGTATLIANSWIHFAVTRSSGTLRIFINGVQAGSVSNSLDCTNTVCNIGANPTGGEAFSGYIANARVVKGTAVYTAAFTPPTALLTAISGTSLLLNATNAGIFDSTAKNDLETVADAQVSTTQAKWGTTSMKFDGTGDYLVMPNNPLYDFGTGNFTIEGWVYVTSLSGSAQETFVGRGVAGGASFHIALTTAGNWVYYLSSNNTTWNIASAVSIGSYSLNNWQHIALVRNGTTFTPYLNGVAGTTSTSSSAIYWSSASAAVNCITVGATETGTQPLFGYIDDLRITRGVARYTANFTAPTAAFPLQ
jgi:hypothetical protein